MIYIKSLAYSVTLTLIAVSCGRHSEIKPEETHLLASACGTVLGTFQGVSAYSNGANTGSGNSCAGRGDYGLQYQCVELVSRYFTQKYNTPRFSCNAKDCMSVMSSSQFNKMYNGSISDVQPGDAIVFGSGAYGHIALVTSVSGSNVTYLQQNTASAYGSVTVSNGSAPASVQGFMHYVNAPSSGGGDSGSSPGGSTVGGTDPASSDAQWDEFTSQFKLLDPSKLKCSTLHVTNLSNDKTVRIRKAPSKSAPVVTSIADGTTITISGAIAGNEETKVTDPDLARSGKTGSKGEPGVEYIWLKLASPVQGWLSKLYAECS